MSGQIFYWVLSEFANISLVYSCIVCKLAAYFESKPVFVIDNILGQALIGQTEQESFLIMP